MASRGRLPLREAQRRWAELLRRIYEVDPLRCSQCAGPMRIVAFIPERGVIDRILTHLAARPEHRPEARGPPAPPPATQRRRRAAHTRLTGAAQPA
jgi:hypothetical protein